MVGIGKIERDFMGFKRAKGAYTRPKCLREWTIEGKGKRGLMEFLKCGLETRSSFV